MAEKTRDSEAELEEFRAIIMEKLELAPVSYTHLNDRKQRKANSSETYQNTCRNEIISMYSSKLEYKSRQEQTLSLIHISLGSYYPEVLFFEYGKPNMDLLIAFNLYRVLGGIGAVSYTHLFDSSFQFYFSRIHQWRMESTTHFQRKSTFGSGSFHQFASLFDTRYRAGDNDLSRAVVVGRYANFTFCIYCCADLFYFFIRQCDNGLYSLLSSYRCNGAKNVHQELV